MQILGLSESTPKPENRLKNLVWPRVQYPEDVDYLGSQGFWVCIVIALFTLLVGAFRHQAVSSSPDALYFYLAGVGIRQRSRFAAVTVFLIYFLSVIVAIWVMHTGGIASLFFLALLLSNVRGTWVAHRFVAEQSSHQPHLPRDTSLMQKFTDLLPRIVWPVGKWLYYALAVLELVGLSTILFRGSTPLRR
ncbi:MAG TPA: hypothetical protein VH325_10965 [Bryobacteraceae bacterium]|jgi:hypothetical protein|nr:hypothetical protein [Bryobacteraceae bacterium]